jgi:hypothetical protein
LIDLVTNDGSYSLDVYNGESNLGSIGPKSSQRFALLHGGGVSVRVPVGKTVPVEGRINSLVQYICGG